MAPLPERLRELIATQQAIVQAGLHPDEVMQLVTDRAAPLLRADAAIVELVDGEEMVYRATTAGSRQHLGLRLSRHTSLSGACVRDRTVLRCDDTELDPRVDRAATRRVGVRSMLVAPLLHRDGAVGVLKVLHRDPHGFDEDDVQVLELLAGFIAAAIGNAQDHETVQHRANHDALTGLPNRALLDDRLDRALRRTHRSGHAVAILALDLDGFKGVNDELGHAAGDAVLEVVAARLQANLRATDTVARVGGDEFVVVAEDLDPGLADALVERIRTVLALPVHTPDGLACVGTSIGCVWGAAEDDRIMLLARADAAMYADKRRHGRHAHDRHEVLQASV